MNQDDGLSDLTINLYEKIGDCKQSRQFGTCGSCFLNLIFCFCCSFLAVSNDVPVQAVLQLGEPCGMVRLCACYNLCSRRVSVAFGGYVSS